MPNPIIGGDMHEKHFKVPMEERLYIYPKPRVDLFVNLVENYGIFCPKLEVIYAALNYDSTQKSDYLIIMQPKDNRKNPMILWDAPILYSNRTVPSYRYAVKNNLYMDFFTECVAHLARCPVNRFVEFLGTDLCGNLSLDPKDPRFWKSPDNAPILLKGMSEFATRFKPIDFQSNRPKEYF